MCIQLSSEKAGAWAPIIHSIVTEMLEIAPPMDQARDKTDQQQSVQVDAMKVECQLGMGITQRQLI